VFVSKKGAVLFPLICLCFFLSLFLGACGSTGTAASSGVINVVAAENFYGDVVKQLGGSHVSVTSILSDPNIDPHEYESNNATAQVVSRAQLVIENGLEYDSWMEKLLSASPNPNRVVLTAGNIADHKLPDNPHIWYGINNMPTIATAITNKLKKLDSADASTFDRNLTTFTTSLQPLLQKITDLKAKYTGTPVGLTETIFLYQTTPIGLNVLTTITSITAKMHDDAKNATIPIVSVWETMPVGKTYQSWMQGQLDDLGQALATATGK